jgi:hypothetical protein
MYLRPSSTLCAASQRLTSHMAQARAVEAVV